MKHFFGHLKISRSHIDKFFFELLSLCFPLDESRISGSSNSDTGTIIELPNINIGRGLKFRHDVLDILNT